MESKKNDLCERLFEFAERVIEFLKTLPDNVLFEGGAGESIRKNLLDESNLHTILRLPTGVFYAHGVKANVLFFEKRKNNIKPATKDVWFYDYRTNIRHTPKKNPLRYEHLKDFISCFNPTDIENREDTWIDNNGNGRWRKYSYNEIVTRDKTNLDIFWLKDENLIDFENLPEPESLIDEIIENIENALVSFRNIKEDLE